MERSNNNQQRNSQVMDLKQLISTPLIATLQADAMTTKSYINFLKEVAFEPAGDGSLGKLRTFSFQYYQQENGQRLLKSVEIPVISLIPIPLLQIKEATFDFDIQILDAVTEYEEASFSFEKEEKENEESGNMFLRAALAAQSGDRSEKRDTSLAANMKIHVLLHQADVPAGLANLLALSAHNLSIEDVPQEESPFPGEGPKPLSV